jgi:uncharacterized transporter YbjL
VGACVCFVVAAAAVDLVVVVSCGLCWWCVRVWGFGGVGDVCVCVFVAAVTGVFGVMCV